MKKVIVASTNPVKIQAVTNAFRRMFPKEVFDVAGISVPSGVSHQPMSDAETHEGARTRARNASSAFKSADYCVGIEGGAEENDKELYAFAWIFVLSQDGRIGESRSATFLLPPSVSELVRRGIELGEADDRVFGRRNSKQANGAVGLLTEDVVDRTALYEQPVALALIPFKNPELY